jgi:hypothetical protein
MSNAVGNTEPSLDGNVLEGVTTTKAPNWPEKIPATWLVAYFKLAESSRQWLESLKPLAAPRCHLEVNGTRYSLNPSESLGGNEKSLPAECIVVTQSLTALAQYGIDLRDLYTACWYAKAKLVLQRNTSIHEFL